MDFLDIPFFVPVVLLVVGSILVFSTIRHFLSKSSHKVLNQWDEYVATDREASFTRAVPIPQEILLPISMESIPQIHHNECDKVYEKLVALSSKPMANLTNYTNTDLKKMYGIANLDTIATYEERYFRFMDLLIEYAIMLKKHSYPEAAIEVCTYALHIGCQKPQCLTLLTELNASTCKSDKPTQGIPKNEFEV